ncbi:23S rRNA (uracil(1939)-C(5))-methyltransferase RlmD [Gemella sp. GH3]|uniref:23S rRNA (uracil(1939)-C(5))-methyltransferase RlmD n=1 Tax=unclassified Gemella TaxID=2624949 RepID=UPI0015D01641|nr:MULTISPECIES: 23S rRNA (uracil(1939)-C(5))-methyltransferase RlmD [unclassified Gemella]MBF0714626.1 23S rRNA (uracil(1939)-C(5))-methyltransferase RlmD [Gemella sp. GH3.1]NYS51578.1 23S rRNA (uracil(1939)-C(5))-methyltransferase RlmD [Gemella sp. GH3]
MKRSILLTIKKNGINGEGIGYYKKKITFVKGALPGEIVECVIIEENSKYIKANLLKIKEKSSYRVSNVRKEFLDSGAYNLIHVDYAKQLEFKRDIVVDAFSKYLKGKNIEIENTIASPIQIHYRNKNQFPVAIRKGKLIAGLYKEGTNELVNVTDCVALHKNGNKVTELIKKSIVKFNLPVSSSKKFKGIKYISTRTSFATGDVQVIFIANTRKINNLEKAVNHLKKEKIIKSIVLNITNEKSHLLLGDETISLYGKDYIIEKIGNVSYKLSANSFFQLNPIQTKNLFDIVVDVAKIKKSDVVLDAFCGVGVIGQYVSKYSKEIYGVDIVEDAIINAKENIKLNNLTNCNYEAGDATNIIQKWRKEGINFDVVIVDPPRSGLGNLAKHLLSTKAKKIVYVSCNPSTLAKDLNILTRKYKIKRVIPLDMFPQTAQVETVVLLSKINK